MQRDEIKLVNNEILDMEDFNSIEIDNNIPDKENKKTGVINIINKS